MNLIQKVGLVYRKYMFFISFPTFDITNAVTNFKVKVELKKIIQHSTSAVTEQNKI